MLRVQNTCISVVKGYLKNKINLTQFIIIMKNCNLTLQV